MIARFAAAPELAPPKPALPLGWAALLAFAGGLAMTGAYAPLSIWPLTFVGVIVSIATLRGRRLGGGFLVGLAFGLGFFIWHVEWAGRFLGWVPWLALGIYMALWVGLGAILITLAYRWVPRVWPSRLGRMLLLPVIVAGLWTAREGVVGVWPWGGFAWGRIADAFSTSPIIHLFAWVGTSGVSFLVVLLCAMTLEAVREVRVPRLLRATVVVAAATLLVVIPAFPIVDHGTVRVGAVQGNPRAGYFQQRAYGQNLDAQVAASKAVYGKGVDVVIWPEGSSDRDPLEDPRGTILWERVATAADAPLFGGAITQRGSRIYNTVIDWDPKRGDIAHYDKHHPVPFGEYVPERAFFEALAPSLVNLIGRDYTPGTTKSVMPVGSRALAGVAICFDIVDDQLMRDAVSEGADVLFAQTNNADFGDNTDESVQQLAIARTRALELGRSVVNISTVGTSAVLLADGETTHQLPTYRPGVIVANVPLSTTITPAAALGLEIEWLVGGFGLLALVVAGIEARRVRR